MWHADEGNTVFSSPNVRMRCDPMACRNLLRRLRSGPMFDCLLSCSCACLHLFACSVVFQLSVVFLLPHLFAWSPARLYACLICLQAHLASLPGHASNPCLAYRQAAAYGSEWLSYEHCMFVERWNHCVAGETSTWRRCDEAALPELAGDDPYAGQVTI